MSEHRDHTYSTAVAISILVVMLMLVVAWLVVYVVSAGVVLLWLLEVFLLGASMPAH